MALAQISQDDFAVGTLRGIAQDVLPGVGVHQALNGMINDDGDIYLRGATLRYSATPMLDGQPIRWVWSGNLGDFSYVLAATDNAVWHIVGDVVTVVPAIGVGLTRPVLGAVIGSDLFLPNLFKVHADAAGVLGGVAWTRPAALALAPAELHVCAAAGRLVVGCGNRVAFSHADDPMIFDALDYHQLPGGVIVMGLFAIQDTVLVFTNFGLWTITNLAYDLTDAAGNVQHTLNLIVPGLSLLHESGLCPWQGRVVAPCVDKVYLVDPVNPPTSISDSINELYDGYTALAATCGGAKVFRDTLLLPMIDRFNVPIALFTCRLNRPVKARYLYYPWTELSGHPVAHAMFDFAPSLTGPILLGGGQDSFLDDLTQIFSPHFAGPDADGTLPEFIVETRDFPTGQGQPNHVKRVRLNYSAAYSGGVLGELEMFVSSDGFDQEQITLEPQPIAPVPPSALTGGDTSAPLSWWLDTAARRRYMRLRLRVVDRANLSSLVVHRVELRARGATHAR